MNKFTDNIIFREAEIKDIPQIQAVRHYVKENRLTDPGLVTDQDCAEYMFRRGKGWVCEAEDQVVGFSIADLKDHSIWALFVRPEFEGRGIGLNLYASTMDWYFSQTDINCWLGTAPRSRAAYFYRKAGRTETGTNGVLEIKFEMKKETWIQVRQHTQK